MKRSIRDGVLRVVTAALVCAVALSVTVSTLTARRNVLDAREDQLQGTVSILGTQITAFIEENRRTVLAWRTGDGVYRFTEGERSSAISQQISRELLELRTLFPQFRTIHVLGTDGIVRASADVELIGELDLSDREYVRIAVQGTSNASDVAISRVTGEPFFAIAVPLVDQTAIVQGVLMVTVDLPSFNRRFVNTIHVGETGYAYLARRDGLVFSHPRDDLAMVLNVAEHPWGEAMMEGGREGILRYRFEGVPRIAAWARSETTGWLLVVTVEEADILAGLPVLVTRSVVAGVLVSAIAALILWYFLRRSLSGIGTVCQAIGDIAQGEADLTQRISYRSTDEIGDLVTTFNAFLQGQSDLITAIKTSAGETVEHRQSMERSATETAGTTDHIARTAAAVRADMTAMEHQIRDSEQRARVIHEGTEALAGEIHQQAEAVEQSTAAIEQMMASLRSVARIVQEKQEAAAQLYRQAGENETQLTTTSAQIGEVVDLVGKIGSITQVIGQLTAQTNLLAMNAAIEAAHAGDAGAGFAVVAEEIRNLASNSGASSREIRTLVKEIIARVETAGASTTRSVEAFRQLYEEIDRVSRAFSELSGTVEELTGGSNEILAAMHTLQDTSQNLNEKGAEMRDALGILSSTLSEAAQVSAKTAESMTGIDGNAGIARQAMAEMGEQLARVAATSNHLLEMVQAYRTEAT